GVGLVKDLAGDMGNDAAIRGQGQQAADMLAKAQEAQRQAAAAIAASSPQAPAAQQQAATALQRAAMSLQEMGKMIAQKAAENPPEPGEPSRLDDALAAAEQAAQGGGQQDIDQASQMLNALAQQAGAAARQMGLGTPGEPAGAPGQGQGQSAQLGGQPGQGGNPKGSPLAQVVPLSPHQLKDMGLVQMDWEELHGQLSDQVLQGSQQHGPEEYRELIKEYSEAITKEKNGPGK
ncbi:MAG: hypothetical protein NT031_06905, partial [Planctomycetota bacterium]|nr:hypothetical protein [Planctomycetota bacterium]